MSREGTGQNDNIAMSFCTIEILPLLLSLKTKCPNINQISLADDAIGVGKVKNLKIWWDDLVLQGQKDGNYINCDGNYKLAKSQPQAAYTAFTHGKLHKYTYIMRTLMMQMIFYEKYYDLMIQIYYKKCRYLLR